MMNPRESRIRSDSQPLLRIRDLAVSFAPSSQGGGDERRVAVDGVSLSLHAGQMLAVVGESGSGKSVTALSVLGLLPQNQATVERGEIEFEGRDLLRISRRELLRVRGGQIAMIFQEPMTSLNPVYTIGEQIIEAIQLHQTRNTQQAQAIAIQSLERVGIRDPAQRLRAYPHQFSGGMRQRVMIAMALACKPKLLIADEPTTALDVTIQAQILELLAGLQRDHHLGILLITHDLGVVARHADVVCVMYAGRVVEYARVGNVISRPLHPYTRALLRCRPALGEKRSRLTTIQQILSEPSELAPIRPGLPPWWPARVDDPEESLDRLLRSDAHGVFGRYALVEVQPEHWVACRVERDSAHIHSEPDVGADRPAVAPV